MLLKFILSENYEEMGHHFCDVGFGSRAPGLVGSLTQKMCHVIPFSVSIVLAIWAKDFLKACFSICPVNSV